MDGNTRECVSTGQEIAIKNVPATSEITIANPTSKNGVDVVKNVISIHLTR